MRKKIFESECPWDKNKRLIIYLDETIWLFLCFKFGLAKPPKIIIRKWWHNKYRLRYFCEYFLKIKWPGNYLKAEYQAIENRILFYPEIILFIYKIKNEEELIYYFSRSLAHEFGHAFDRSKIFRSMLKALKCRSKKFVKKEIEIIESRARQFADKFGKLFEFVFEIEIR